MFTNQVLGRAIVPRKMRKFVVGRGIVTDMLFMEPISN